MVLLDGEEIIFKTKLHSNMSDFELDDAYNQTNHRLIIDQGRYPVDQLVNMFLETGRMNDKSDYQRGKTWGYDRKSRLIESLIMNIPIPPVYLFERDYNKYDILDGKQRISALVEFYNNDYELEGLDVWSGLNGKKYNELTPTLKNALNRSYISSIVIMKESSNNNDNTILIRTIFERLNSGGIALTTQESRNAILSGSFNSMCKSLVADEQFKNVWGINRSQRQTKLFGNDDFYSDFDSISINFSEYPLRFFAYRQIDKMETSLSAFLDEYLKFANQYSTELINKLHDLFLETFCFAYDILDQKPFRIGRNATAKPNLLIYDPLMQALSRNLEWKDLILRNKRLFIDKYYEIVNDKKLFNGKYSHKKIVIERIKAFNKILEECI